MRSNSSSDSSVEGNVAADFLSLSAFKNLLKLKPQDRSTVICGTQELPASEFGKEMREERRGFPLAELNEREGEEYRIAGVPFGDLRESLAKLKDF
ncbi:hypothetical protein Patl1_15253 [Pistacia atlantica]|uniref:Uncharacterized protein n=1 Tax=Pistacia atlantica TaxID=434234 RepID=A0ACC1B761_9ROSI|nr:hypothetical protein Patl1_15253 [Pistacia atlantica]